MSGMKSNESKSQAGHSFPIPEFLEMEFQRLDEQFPDGLPKVRLNVRPTGVPPTIESLRAALADARPDSAFALAAALATNNPSSLKSSDLIQILELITQTHRRNYRSVGTREDRLAVWTLAELGERGVAVSPQQFEEMANVFAQSRPSTAIACLRMLRKVDPKLTMNRVAILVRAALALTPLEGMNGLAPRILQYALEQSKGNEGKLKDPAALAAMIGSRRTVQEAREWHVRSLAVLSIEAEAGPSESPKTVQTRALLDSRLARVLAREGDVDGCRELLGRYESMGDAEAAPISLLIAEMRSSLIIALLKSDNLAEARSEWDRFAANSKFVASSAVAKLMQHMGKAGDKFAALKLFHEARGKAQGGDQKHLAGAFTVAFSLVHPNVKAERWLIGEMLRIGLPITRQTGIAVASAALASGEDIWEYTKTGPDFAVRGHLKQLVRALNRSANIARLPVVYARVISRALNGDPAFGSPEDGKRAVYQALLARDRFDLVGFLRTEELVAWQFEDGRSGGEWASRLESLRRRLGKELGAQTSVEVGTSEATEAVEVA